MEPVGANSVYAANTGTGEKLSKGKVPVIHRPSCIHFPYHAEGRRCSCSCSLVAFSAHPLYFRIENVRFYSNKIHGGETRAVVDKGYPVGMTTPTANSDSDWARRKPGLGGGGEPCVRHSSEFTAHAYRSRLRR